MTRNAAIAIVLVGLTATACGIGSQGGAPTVSGPATAAPTVSLGAVAPAPTTAPTASPTPAPVYWPLTGIKADDPSMVHRRPLNVRMPNDPAARPLVGLAKADIVFEMIVEGGITRFSAIFQSQDVKAVGPVRSYRWSDLHLTQMLRGALVSSGATIEERDAVTNSIRAGNMISVDAERVGGPYYRVSGRPGPNNEFVDLDAARQAVNAAGGKDPVDVPPLAFFRSLEHDAMAGGSATSVPATTVTIPFQRDPVTFTYDEGSKGYRRSQAGTRTVDPDGNAPIIARNVIVMHTDIWQTSVIEDIYGSRGLDYRMTDGGAAEIFRDGRRVDGRWKRDGVLDQFTFYDQAGEQILLEPGQSWIHFVYPDWSITSSSG
jgi:DUF3048 family protein